MRKEKVLTINLPDEVLFYRGVEIAKRGIAQDIFKYFEDIEKVRYVEEVVKEKTVEKETPKEEQ